MKIYPNQLPNGPALCTFRRMWETRPETPWPTIIHYSRPRMVRDRSGAMVQDGWLYTVAHAGGITELGHEWMVHPS